ERPADLLCVGDRPEVVAGMAEDASAGGPLPFPIDRKALGPDPGDGGRSRRRRHMTAPVEAGDPPAGDERGDRNAIKEGVRGKAHEFEIGAPALLERHIGAGTGNEGANEVTVEGKAAAAVEKALERGTPPHEVVLVEMDR